MAVNIDLIKKRLEKMNQNTKQSNLLWKPTLEAQTIRLVPYKFSPDNPFIELFFHYGIQSRGFLSPQSFGRPDPFVEFAEKLKLTGEKDKWKLAKKIEPKLRTFAPIVVRGKESEGVKFWGFGKTVYTELLTYFANPEYGDLSDPLTGTDITVHQTKDDGRDFPTTHLILKRQVSKLTEDMDLAKNLAESQKDITEIYEEKTYEEIYQILQTWMTAGDPNDDSNVANANANANGDANANANGDGVVVATPAPKSTKVESKTPAKAENIASAFDELFNK